MHFVIIPVAMLAVVVVPFLINRVIKKRLEERCAQVEDWEEWSVEERQEFVGNFIRAEYEGSALAWRVGLILGLAIVLFLGAQQWLIYNVANDSRHVAKEADDLIQVVGRLAAENCRLNQDFLQDEADDATRDIRRLQRDRDTLADTITATPTEVRDIPSYFDAPFWFQRFLGDLLDEQIADANISLGTMDADLIELRDRRDEIQGLLNGIDCPRE